jgi:hypothetical protein
MPQRPESELCDDNAPSQFRLQHGAEKPITLYDEAYSLGIIDAGQHSDMVHFAAMREEFMLRNQPRDTVIGRLIPDARGGDGESISMADKFSRLLREMHSTTISSLIVFTSPKLPTHTRKMFYQASLALECHLDALRKWLDDNR